MQKFYPYIFKTSLTDVNCSLKKVCGLIFNFQLISVAYFRNKKLGLLALVSIQVTRDILENLSLILWSNSYLWSHIPSCIPNKSFQWKGSLSQLFPCFRENAAFMESIVGNFLVFPLKVLPIFFHRYYRASNIFIASSNLFEEVVLAAQYPSKTFGSK